MNKVIAIISINAELVIDKSIPKGKEIGKRLTILNCSNGEATIN
jgi:hypothetical protein